ncbi:MAG: multiubiquitin domain-containing protein [Pseudohongiellaceae bacterium]
MYQIKIDGQEYPIDDRAPTGEQILALAGKKYPDWALNLEVGSSSVPVSKDQKVDMEELGSGFFRTSVGKPDKGKPDKPNRSGATFPIVIKIDGAEYQVSVATLTGEQIMALAGKNYNEYSLNQKLQSGRRIPIEKETEVNLTNQELDRFETAPLQATQGEQGGSSYA